MGTRQDGVESRGSAEVHGADSPPTTAIGGKGSNNQRIERNHQGTGKRTWKRKAYGADYKAQYEHFANAIKTAYDAHSPETIEMIKNARARSNNYDIRPVQPRLRLATGAVNTAIIII